MKVVMLSTFGPEVRGISYYSDCLLAALQAADGLEVEAVDYEKVYPDWLHPAGRQTVRVTQNHSVHYARPWTWNLNRYQPGVLHLQSWTTITSLIHLRVLKKARQAGIPTVLTLHNPASHEQRGVLAGVEKRCLELCDAIVIHDQCGMAALPESCRYKVRVIPHGTEVLHLTGQELQQVDQNAPYLLYFGNIRPYKGVELLLSAWKACEAQFPAMRLIVAGQLWQGNTGLSRFSARLLGTEKYARGIKQLASDPQLQRVEFRFGFIDDEELDHLIRGARYTIFPYLKFSGHSGAVSRSAANGTPVLVSDAGGLSSLVTEPGNVFPAGNLQALSEMLVRKLQSPAIDFQERKGQLEKARQLSWDHAATLHKQLYAELLQQHSATGRSLRHGEGQG